MRWSTRVGVTTGLVLGVGCGSTVILQGRGDGGDGTQGGGGGATGTGGADPSTTSSTGGVAVGGMGGQGGEPLGDPCASVTLSTSVEKAPADIIFVVDNSGSMSDEINAIEQNINVNFANVMAAAQLDYQVIMLTNHGTGSYDVCVAPPLSGSSNCSGPPAEVPGRFYHYDIDVQSHDSLCILLGTAFGSNAGGEPDEHGLHPDGWVPLLRPNALKFFIEISDDRVNCVSDSLQLDDMVTTSQLPQPGQKAAVDFDTRLLQLSAAQFGTTAKRRYKFYSIVGVTSNNPPSKPYDLDQPFVSEKCNTAVNEGPGYQWLAKGTGGYRFPVCNVSDYGPIFEEIANDVLVTSAIPCSIDLPEAPEGQTFDLDEVTFTFQPDPSSPAVVMDKVPSVAECEPGKTQFYVDSEGVQLCPAACAQVSADSVVQGQVTVDLYCE
ncbi:MAG: hypothetical protein KC731_14950 [Myxococcales bacterium]|nr:hypothetical protein [Myxococcales bacterium]